MATLDLGKVTLTSGEQAVLDSLSINANGEVESSRPVVETMDGYSFTPYTKQNITVTPIYVGASRNGNKLTIVYFGKVTRTGEVANDFTYLGNLYVPTAILNKLYPEPLGILTGCLFAQNIAFYSAPKTKIDENVAIIKESTSVSMAVYGVNDLTLNEEYQCRVEATFLLGENMVE